MKIDSDQILPGAAPIRNFSQREEPRESFAGMLETERVKAENETARSEILANQVTKGETLKKEEIEFIREYGMRAFAEETHDKKIEELREKILEAMGLTEEVLAEMPAYQRMTLENMIAREIQERVAADSMINGGSGPEGPGNRQAAAGSVGPGNLLAAQVMSGDPGALAGMVMAEAVSEDAAGGDKAPENNNR